MGYLRRQGPGWREVLSYAAAQYGVVTHAQLVALGLSAQGVKHRVQRGRLHRVYRGVYAVGRQELSANGRRMAGLLAVGPSAAISYSSAGDFWSFASPGREIEITVCPPRQVGRRGLRVHRTTTLTPSETITVGGIAVTDPLRTLTDLATRWTDQRVDDAIERIHQIDLRSPAQLADELDQRRSIPGTARVRERLTRWTAFLTDSQLERRFLPIAKRAGLPRPLTQETLNGYRVDFFFPYLGLVVEADSLRYHRTAARQSADARRDQTHIAAGLIPVRFTHTQITYEPNEVERTLRRVASQCRARGLAR
jgi:very-short-patch-repair endonuclease